MHCKMPLQDINTTQFIDLLHFQQSSIFLLAPIPTCKNTHSCTHTLILIAVRSLCFGDGKWVLVMHKDEITKNRKQTWRYRREFPDKDIAELWKQGYYVSIMGHGDGMW